MSNQQQFYEGLVNPGQLQPGSGTTKPVPVVLPQIKYYNTITQYDRNSWIDGFCAEIAFLNIGDGATPPTGQNVTILGFTIKPGFGISFDGNEAELDVTKYQIVFSGTGVANCSVFRKMYV
jgi:hypothetical protein